MTDSEIIARIDGVNKSIELCVKAMDTRLEGIDKAIELKSQELDRRLEGLNQLRGEVTRDRDQFVKKETFDIKMDELNKMGNRVTAIETRSIVWTTAIAVIFVVIQILLKLWK